jgi:zinc transport system substrate-binding protein
MNRRFRNLSVLASCLLAAYLLTLIGCHKATDPWATVEGGKLKVLVTFPPLYCFTKGVAGNDAKVVSMLSATGPHEHKPQADDAQVAAGADLFLSNGLGLDEFVPKVAKIAGNTKVKIVEIAEDGIPQKDLIKFAKGEGEAEGDHDHGPGHEGHKHGEWDPHVWLGTEQAILMVQKICATLKEADAAHAADYDKRAGEYVEKLKKLQVDGKKMLEGKKNRKMIASHESLAYFCKSFDLEMKGSIMPLAGVEPDAVQMAKLEKLCKEDNVKIIAIEPQFSRKDAETLQKALEKKGHKLAIVEIDPMETAPHDQLMEGGGDYYFRVMRRNLENLAKNLE